jgi:hypothetical protein
LVKKEEAMYHNWYELHIVARQVQKDLYRQADKSRLADATRKSQKEEKRHAMQARLAAATTVVSGGATFILRRNEVISICVWRRPYRIACVTGRLWTTITDSPADAVLVAGETITYCNKGKIVVQALDTTTIRIDCRSPMRIAAGSPFSPVFQPG